MFPARQNSWLPLAALLVPVTLALAWLLLFVAGDHGRLVRLPHPPDASVELLREHGRAFTREEVAQFPPAAWQPRADPLLFAPEPHEVAWVRVTLHNPTDRAQSGVLGNFYVWIDRVEAWIEDGGAWTHVFSGERAPAATKAIAGRDIAFPVEVPAHGTQIIYVRLEDRFHAIMAWEWWPNAPDFYAAKMRGLLAEGVYFGGLLALLGYNALLWLRLRQPDIGCYVRYLAASAAFIALARGFLPAAGVPLGSPLLETLLTLALALSLFSLTQFARVFLELSRHTPRGDGVARGLQIVVLALAAGSLTTAWLPRLWWLGATILMGGVVHLVLPVLGVLAWRARVWQARYFLVSFAALFLGALMSVVAWVGHVLADYPQRCLMIGSALELMLLSLAVADRFRQAQRETILAQEQLVAETEQRRLIEETYADELEIEVRERTRELEEANADKDRMLAIIGHDLRSPLTGLMRTADEATGEFARETARTGRALLLLIEDLVLWARLRAGTRSVAIHPARAVLAPAVALHHALAERGGTQLVLEVPDDLRIATDLVLGQTLVRNLLANALKFAERRVILRAAADPAGVRFTIGNDGPALSAEVAARIAADEDAPMTATGGLGLRLCREICRALGTRLEARSATETGTEFSFILPSAPTTAGTAT